MFSSQLAGLDNAMEATKVIALLLIGWTLLGLSKGKCMPSAVRVSHNILLYP